MQRFSWYIWAIMGVCLTAVTAWSFWPRPDEPLIRAKAIRKDFVWAVPVSGRLYAAQATTVTCPIETGEEVVKLVPEGTLVTKGDVLLEFDDENLRYEVRKSELEMASREAERDEAVARLHAETEKMVLDIEKYKKDIAISTIKLVELKSHPQPDELQISQMEYEQAVLVMEMAKKEYDRFTKELQPELVVGNEIRPLAMELQKAISAYRKSELNLRLVASGPLPWEVEKVELEKAKKSLELKQAERAKPDKIKQLQSRVTQTNAKLETAQMLLTKSREKLRLAQVRAPGDGLVIYREVWGKKVTLGGRYWLGAPLLDIPDLKRMELRGEVLERQIELVRPGMVAQVRIAAFPDQIVPGRVRKIGKVAVDTSERELVGAGEQKQTTGIKVFEVFIEIDATSVQLLPQMSARAFIQIAQIPEALVIPSLAVIEKQGTAWVWLASDQGKPERRFIETGLANDYETTVVKGLQDGDWVILQPAQ